MTAPEIIKDLVRRFDEHRDAHRSGKYNETQLRREFLDPFLEALGWDVINKQNYAEMYKDVIHEDSLEIEGENKAPDYAFRIGGTRKFFVEAKKPAVNIEMNIHPAFQLRRYAWSAKLALSILTDFEEFAVYDCRAKPDKADKASTGRVKLISYKDYIEKWDEIADIFSREAVLKGSFDSYAEGMNASRKRGTLEVDDAFLIEIERWRDLLAKNIAIRNPSLSVRELNYAVQMTIDRIVFLRISEDRGVERDEQLKEISAGKDVYSNLVQLFKRADARYNSGLFHFTAEKEQSSSADSLTLSLNVDDKVLQDILRNLYYPESPYVFREIPSDILGQVYERFLGKVIRLTAGHQAKVEEKPEVRKAGGVFYTPTFIVENIVLNTVGKLLEGKTPKEVARLKFLDPACGSGTFPLGAFQYLLDWHLKYYLDHEPEKWAAGKSPAIYQVKDGYRLTTAKKKEILLNNIFGVDIDAQAVEVTKLSLLLKVLEGENNETIGSQLRLFQERVLPDLGRNIKCGNSLIGYDYFEGRMLVEQAERERVNPFDWKAEFSQVFAQGGFDAVFGNPPYVRQEMLGELKDYFLKHYKTYHGSADLYTYFIELGVSLLKQNGLFCYIVANKWMRANYGEPLRVWLKQQNIIEITDFGDLPVFENATTYPCILRIGKNTPETMFSVTQVKSLNSLNLNEYVKKHHYMLDQFRLEDSGWSLANDDIQKLLDKLNRIALPLDKYTNAKMYRGIVTGYNEAFVVDLETKNKLITEDPKSAEIIKPFLAGRDIKRYTHSFADRYLLFTRRGINIKQYPAIERYLSMFKERLMPKPKDWKGNNWLGRKPGPYRWYEIQDSIDYHEEFEKPKIIIPAIVQNASYTFDKESYYSNDKTSIIVTDDLYLLGVLNSKVVDFVLHLIASTKQGGYYEYKPMYVSQLPIRPINFSDPADKTRHDKLVSLVERMLELHKRSPRTPQEQEMVKREIESTDVRIDRLVYELYGLSEEEIKIVEGK